MIVDIDKCLGRVGPFHSVLSITNYSLPHLMLMPLGLLLGVPGVDPGTMEVRNVHFVMLGRPVMTCPDVGMTGLGTELILGGPTGGVTDQTDHTRSVTSSRRINARQAPSVAENMPASPVAGLTVYPPVKSVKAPSLKMPEFLIQSYWSVMLFKVFDSDKAESLLQDVVHGVAIGRPPASASVTSPNWPSASQFHEQVDRVIAEDLALGRLHGPFVDSPFEFSTVSPLGAFLKRDKVKIRLIHDLSYPQGRSVNSAIDPEEFSLHYNSVDTAVEACGRVDHPVLANIDLKDAYKSVGIRPEDWHLLGLSWDLPGVGPRLYYSRVLSFGLRSAPALFDRFASALEKFMCFEGVSSEIVRYVDDFLVVSESPSHARDDVATMVRVARQAGFTIQDEKVTGPARQIQFLGILIDLDLNQLRISDERADEIRTLLAEWAGRTSASKRKLLRLIGKLAFAARVVRTGRAFLGRLIALAKSVKPLHHHVRLSAAARRDIDWWRECLLTHNGTSMIAVDWEAPDVLNVYTDASGSGCGAVFNREWFALSYVGGMAFALNYSINWRELHVAVRALATWSAALAGRRVIFHIDNAAAGCIIRRLYTPIPDLMELLRQWCLIVEQHRIQVAVRYIATADNTLADALSRGDFDKFKELHGSPSNRVWPQPIAFYEALV